MIKAKTIDEIDFFIMSFFFGDKDKQKQSICQVFVYIIESNHISTSLNVTSLNVTMTNEAYYLLNNQLPPNLP